MPNLENVFLCLVVLREMFAWIQFELCIAVVLEGPRGTSEEKGDKKVRSLHFWDEGRNGRTSVSCFLCIVFSCTVDTGRTLKEKGKFQAILEQIVLLFQHGDHAIICSVVSSVVCAVFCWSISSWVKPPGRGLCGGRCLRSWSFCWDWYLVKPLKASRF